MTKKEFRKELEERFAYNHIKYVGATTQSEKERYAYLSCEMCNLLSLINGTSEDAEMERLYKKYNF